MFLKLYLITLPVFLGIDMVWLLFVAKDFYNKQLGFIMSKNPTWIPAIIFYLLFTGGLVIFVIFPALESKSWLNAVLMGALFGLICYATYDLTNLATIKNWPVLITIIDLIWGTVLSSGVSVISYFIARKLGL
jgi:uncharacterized membrane protein